MRRRHLRRLHGRGARRRDEAVPRPARPRARPRAWRSPTAPAPARAACSATRCASTCAEGFPLLTTKKLHTRSHLRRAAVVPARRRPTSPGCTSNGITIWDEWADADGDLGPIYGHQWRSWPTPGRRPRRPDRAGHRGDPHQPRLPPPHRAAPGTSASSTQMALPPCHAFFQFYVADGRLSLPALPALGRHLPRRAVQHRLLRAADPPGGAGDRPRGRRLRAHPRRRAPVLQPPRAGPAAADPRAASAADAAAEPGRDRASTRSPWPTSRSSTTTRTRASRPRSRSRRAMRVIAIAIVAANGVIGDGKTQPFEFAEDWARYKRVTLRPPDDHGTHAPTTRSDAGCPARTTIVVTQPTRARRAAAGRTALPPGTPSQPRRGARPGGEPRRRGVYVAGGGADLPRRRGRGSPTSTSPRCTRTPRARCVFPPIDPAEWVEVSPRAARRVRLRRLRAVPDAPSGQLACDQRPRSCTSTWTRSSPPSSSGTSRRCGASR